MILDKTGTITFGNRLADEFFPVKGISKDKMIEYSVISSLKDLTPEGRSIVELGKKFDIDIEAGSLDDINKQIDKLDEQIKITSDSSDLEDMKSVMSYLMSKNSH